MTVPTISSPPPVPSRLSDTPATFANKADAWTAWWEDGADELNDAIDAFNTDAATVNTQSAQVATDSAEVAAHTEAVQEIWAQVVAEATSGGSGASGTSVTIGLGSKSFTATSSRLWFPGMAIIARSSSSAASFMAGEVVSYNSSTGALVMTSHTTGGSGSFSDWVIYPTGQRYNPGWTEVTSLAATSGSAVTFSDVDDLPYADLMLEFLGVSHNSGSSHDIRIELSDDGTNWTTAAAIRTAVAGADTLYGTLQVFAFRRASGVIRAALENLTANRTTTSSSGSIRPWRIAAGIAHIRISPASGTFDAGAIKLLGR